MKTLTSTVLTAMVLWLPPLASAQLPGEPKAPPAYDIPGDARYRFQLWAPDERVRAAQRVLQERGYYEGAIDGLMSPEMRWAVWNFQRAQGFRQSGRLEPQTMAALGLGPTEAPPAADSQPSALPRSTGPDGEGSRSSAPPSSLQAP